jgi:tagaturonate reductase
MKLSRSWLNQATLPPGLSHGPLELFPEKVVQFGEGNFLRAFADWMFDALNEQGLFDGRVVVVQPIRAGRAQALNEQDGLYTVVMRGLQKGQAVEQRRVVTAISRALNPYESWAEVTRCFQSPDLRFVVSNTTEAGIALVEEPHRPGRCPESFPAKVAALLHERFQALGGAGAGGLVFLPCELIERNGETLRQIVLQHAQRWNLGRGFVDWVSQSNHFLNTLVDRIVPGHPGEAAAQLGLELGYEDALLDVCEWFHLWVIEGPPHLADELPFHRAGLNVVWTNDLAPYRTRKVRILNGAHTASVLAAFHAGLNTVREMVEDPVLGRFVRQTVFDEILPGVPLHERERADYAAAVLERFGNPFVRHELLSIALNSVSKWRVRVLPSLLDYLRTRGTLPRRLTFSLAALIYFYRGARTSPTELAGHRNGQVYPIRDEAAVLDSFAQGWSTWEQHHDSRQLVAALLAQTPLWGMDLNTVTGLTEMVAGDLASIQTQGVRQAIEGLLA